MRGKDGVNDSAQAVTGITPACAGKSVIRISDGCLRRDHPRVCGEKLNALAQCPFILGSPPRVRGKVQLQVLHNASEGITPACAGKRRSVAAAARSRRDHPRVCGEKYPVMDDAFIDMGSPPRMRGKANTPDHRESAPGITPACAGKRYA